MTAVHIIDTGLSVAPALARLLGLRRVGVSRGDATAGMTAETVVARAAPGAERTATEVARALKARRVVLVDEDAPAQILTEEMGGRLIRVALPRPAAPVAALSDAGLLWLRLHEWWAREDLHLQGSETLDLWGLLFPLNHSPEIGAPGRNLTGNNSLRRAAL